MAFHIVTSKCFLVCDKVTSVTLEETFGQKPKLVKKKKGQKKAAKSKTPVKEYTIAITYYPVSMANSRNDGESTLEVRVTGKEMATKLYGEIIREVQEQHPNEAYLDKLVSKLFETDEFLEVKK